MAFRLLVFPDAVPKLTHRLEIDVELARDFPQNAIQLSYSGRILTTEIGQFVAKENAPKSRLVEIKSLIKRKKPEAAMNLATELIRLYPD